MKTAEEKAKEFCDRFTGLDSNFRACVVLLLKEQDRDTRHAAAEAIMNIQGHYYPGNPEPLLFKNEAHAACMNVKAC